MKIKSVSQRTCSCCGKKYWDFAASFRNHAQDSAWQGDLCDDCASWIKYINSSDDNLEVIAGVCYNFLPPQREIKPGDTLGGGRMKYILKKNGEIKKSNDIWKIGEVPQALRDKLPDTGWWISRKLFRRLKQRAFQCKNKGCYDRYHCLRYNIKQEYVNGPYNKIPRSWCVGGENCPSFCNILEIQHYDNFESID